MKNRIFITGVMGFVLVTLVCCKAEDQKIDLNNGANNPNHTIIDSFNVVAHTMQNDSMLVKGFSANNLGACRSTTYGDHTANIAMSFALPDISGFTFPAGATIDSVVLVLEYAEQSYNGDLNTTHDIDVYRVNKFMSPDSTYYADFAVPTLPAPDASLTSKFTPTDSFTHTLNGKTAKRSPQLRITLDNATVGQELLNGNSSFTTNTVFQNYFPGLFVKCKTTALAAESGSFVRINHKGKYSGIAVYYNDSVEVLFPAKSGNVLVNTTTSNFTGSTVATQFAGGDFNTAYLAPLSSTKILIEVPGLYELSKLTNPTVIAATITIPVDPVTIEPNYGPASRAVLTRRRANGTSEITEDLRWEPALYNGKYDAASQSYVFSIASELQKILNDIKAKGIPTNNGFYLTLPSDNPITATRSTLDMRSGLPQDGIRVKVTLIKTK